MVMTMTVPLVHSRKRKNPIDFIIDASQVNVAVDKHIFFLDISILYWTFAKLE